MRRGGAVDLSGRTVLVVEDDYFIASELSDSLRRVGAVVTGPFASVAEGLAAVRTGSALDCAVLGVNLEGEMVWPVVDALMSRGVPVILTTGYEAEVVPPTYAHLTRLEKPTTLRDVAHYITRQTPR